MKKIIILVILVSFIGVSAQEAKPKKDKLGFSWKYRIALVKPNHFGENALSKGYNSKFGGAFSIDFLKYSNFRTGFEMNRVFYKVVDNSKIGTFPRATYEIVYFCVSYDFSLNEKINIQPKIGFGNGTLSNKGFGRNFGISETKDFRFGFNVDYKLDKGGTVYAGIHYINQNFDIKSAPEFQNYFQKANQIQLSFGFKLN